MTSFYDWYADLPVASPQVFGDQTDVPESGDWWNATYLLMWGSNVPVTRTPDAHWMAEARYKGQKVVVVSPGLRRQHEVRRHVAARPARYRRRAGDGDGPRDAQGVLRRPAGAVLRRLRAAVHRPAVPGHARGAGRRATCPASSSPRPTSATSGEGAAWKTVLVDGRTGDPVVPNGSLGFRYTDVRRGRWNLDLGERRPAADAARRDDVGRRGPAAALRRPRRLRRGAAPRRAGAPGRRPAGHHGVRPDAGPVRRAPRRAARASGRPATTTRPSRTPPAWQEPITSVPAEQVVRIAREMAAQRRGVRRPHHDHHGRRDLPVVPRRRHLPGGAGAADAHRLDGPQRRRLGALRRPGEVPPGHRLGDDGDGDRLAAPAAADDRHGVLVHPHRPVALRRLPRRRAHLPAGARATWPACTRWTRIALSARLGWMPSYPQFDRNPLDLADEAAGGGQDGAGATWPSSCATARCGSRSRTRTRRRTGRAA